MMRIVGSGIEHRDLAIAHQVSVGSGAGHESRIAGDDAPHARREDDGGSRVQRTGVHAGSRFIKFFDSAVRG